MTSNFPALSSDALFAMLRAASGYAGRPDDEGPFVHGPADPIVRAALERVSLFGPSPEPWLFWGNPVPWLGPTPEPWRLAFAAFLREHPEAWELVGWGPGAPVHAPSQRMAFMHALGNVLAQRAEAVQDVAFATSGQAEQRGIIIVSGYVDRVVDEFCGTGFRLWPRGPQPRDPHPPKGFDAALSGADLVGVALSLDRSARMTGSGPLREALHAGATKLMAEGAARLAR